MATPSERSKVVDSKMKIASVRLKIYASRALLVENMVLQYHRGTDRLRIWNWLVTFLLNSLLRSSMADLFFGTLAGP